MKVLCPTCERLSELTRFHLDGEALVVTCAHCGATARVEAAAHEAAAPPARPHTPAPATPASPPGAADAARPVMLPTRRPSLESSPAASNVVRLRTANVDAVEAAAQAADEGPFTVPEGLCPKCLAARAEDAAACRQCGLTFRALDPRALEPEASVAQAWKELLRTWDDEARHNAFCALAAARGELPAAGRLYRLRQAHVPEDPWAQRGRDEVLRLATASVDLRSPTSGGTSARTFKWVVVATIFVLTLVMVGWFLSTVINAARS